jgi:hypothetical protein
MFQVVCFYVTFIAQHVSPIRSSSGAFNCCRNCCTFIHCHYACWYVFLILWFNLKIQSVISFMRSMCWSPVYFCGAVRVSFCCAACRCYAISSTSMPKPSKWQKSTSEPKTACMKGKKYNKQNCFLHPPTFGTDPFTLLCGHKMRSRDSVVGIETSYRLDIRGVGVRVPVGSRIFSSPCRPD